MPATIEIPIYNGWMPDLSHADIIAAKGLKEAKNCLPVNGDYIGMLDKSAWNTTAVSGTAYNGIAVQDTDAQYYNFLGTSTKLYRFTKSLMTDITALAGAYNGSFWNFAEYGSWLIATNFSDAVQVLKGLTSANFQALGGSPPKAKFVHYNNGHLILAHLDESGTVYPKKLTWSAREDVEDFTASLTTGADSQEFPDMIGNITGIGAIGSSFVIASEGSLTIGYYVGGAYTYNFKVNAVVGIGCYYPQSFISVGNECFFWGKHSIYRFDGNSYREIGRALKETVVDNVHIEYSNRMTVTHDRSNHLIMWAYPSVNSTGSPDKILVYNYEEDRFTWLDIAVECLFVGATGGITIDEVTTLADLVAILVDSNYWLNNNIQPLCVNDSDSKVNAFSGSALTSEVETGELTDDEDRVLMISKVKPQIKTMVGSGSVIIKSRYSEQAGQSSSASSSIKTDNTADVRTSNRRIAVNMQVTGFSKIGRSIKADISASGGR